MDASTRDFILKLAGVRGPMNIFPPKSLGDKGIQSVLKDVSKRKKLTKQPFPYPSEVLDRVAGRIADTGFLRKKSALDETAVNDAADKLTMPGIALGGITGAAIGERSGRPLRSSAMGALLGMLALRSIGRMEARHNLSKEKQALSTKVAKKMDLRDIEENLGVYVRGKKEQEQANKGIEDAYASSFSLRHPYLTGIPTLGIAPAVAKGNALEKIRHMLLRNHPDLHKHVMEADELRHKREIELMPERIEEGKRQSHERMMGMGALTALSALQSIQDRQREREQQGYGYEKEAHVLNKQALIGPSIEIGNLGLPSAIGYFLGHNNEKNKTLEMSYTSKDDDEFRSNLIKRINEDSPSTASKVIKFLLIPGYTGYRLGKGGGRTKALRMLMNEKAKRQKVEGPEKQARCWEGFEPVPGKKAYSEGSCRPKTETTKRVHKKADDVSLEELNSGIKKLSELKKKGTSQVTIYFASPSQQLNMIPRDAMVSTSEDLAFQMGRFYPNTKERWGEGDISGKWNGATPPTWKAGRIPTGRPKLYRATVSTADLANVTNMVRDIKKLKRSVTATAVKNRDEEN